MTRLVGQWEWESRSLLVSRSRRALIGMPEKGTHAIVRLGWAGVNGTGGRPIRVPGLSEAALAVKWYTWMAPFLPG